MKQSLAALLVMTLVFAQAQVEAETQAQARGDSAMAAEPPAPASAGFLHLPPGFKAQVLVDNVPNARSMALAADGTLFVGTMSAGVVYAVRDALGAAPVVTKFAAGLSMPNGVALLEDDLYVAEQKQLVRYRGAVATVARGASPSAAEVIDPALPFKGFMHSWKYLAFGPDGKLYVSIGSPCNVCVEPGFGVILRMNPDGTGREVFASGIRNSVGFTWQPGTRDLWFTDNGRDMLGDDVPPDELNRAPKAGLDFGFPYCHAGSIPDPKYGDLGQCSASVPPVQKLGPHVASLGVKFYTGQMFPADYRGQVLIAEHGSWNRSKAAGKTGYRISLVRLKGGKAVSYTPFITGWLDGDEVRGRPVDLLVAPDGSLLVSDDQRGVIYRISYAD
ncbi:MAG: sorbosone dehydrogenase family protein [Gammaproteobacteria bacterium PRO9]|nr:sorbosone dehydrogenase family protein [Gammaproteobacteria bacterium PRO9]